MAPGLVVHRTIVGRTSLSLLGFRAEYLWLTLTSMLKKLGKIVSKYIAKTFTFHFEGTQIIFTDLLLGRWPSVRVTLMTDHSHPFPNLFLWMLIVVSHPNTRPWSDKPFVWWPCGVSSNALFAGIAHGSKWLLAVDLNFLPLLEGGLLTLSFTGPAFY